MKKSTVAVVGGAAGLLVVVLGGGLALLNALSAPSVYFEGTHAKQITFDYILFRDRDGRDWIGVAKARNAFQHVFEKELGTRARVDKVGQGNGWVIVTGRNDDGLFTFIFQTKNGECEQTPDAATAERRIAEKSGSTSTIRYCDFGGLDDPRVFGH